MKIFATGTSDRLDEFRKIVPEVHSLVPVSYDEQKKRNTQSLNEFDLIIDLNLDEHPERINQYGHLTDKAVVVGAVKMSLSAISSFSKNEIACRLIGFNSLPTFINSPKKEVSFLNAGSKEKFSLLAEQLNWKWLEVKDTTGMIAPRVIMMMINEACFTLQEGTANKNDIDKGMKLGTAYPFGPFEWADRIGIRHVYETLEALYKDKDDIRYTVAPLLKSMFLKGENFYNNYHKG